MARRNRRKRERRRTGAGAHDARPSGERVERPKPPPSARAAYPGARVARVAVDDETWDAFRVLCGSTPASVRLGELVAAEVKLARAGERRTSAAATAAREIRERATELERLLGGS